MPTNFWLRKGIGKTNQERDQDEGTVHDIFFMPTDLGLISGKKDVSIKR